MLGFGIIELISISLLILILFRPKELPVLARTIVRWIHEMKNIFHQLEKQWNLPVHPKHLDSTAKNTQHDHAKKSS